MDKQQRRDALKRWKDAERSDLIANSPVSPEQLRRLLDYLSDNLKSCAHTRTLTIRFVDVEELEKDEVLSWLAEHGGFCDCEVLANLTDIADVLDPSRSVPERTIQPKRKSEARDLRSVTGWKLSGLPAPWRISNLYDPAQPVRLEIGRKSGCSITILEFPLTLDQPSEEFWSRRWYERTELPPKGPLHVSHGVLNLPDILASTLVRSPSWLPVYCWIVPETNSWHLEVRTDSTRWAGDRAQISALISRLANGGA